MPNRSNKLSLTLYCNLVCQMAFLKGIEGGRNERKTQKSELGKHQKISFISRFFLVSAPNLLRPECYKSLCFSTCPPLEKTEWAN